MITANRKRTLGPAPFFTLLLVCFSGMPRELHAQRPMTGVPVPELQIFDREMQDFMDQWDLGVGVLAVSRNGCIVYQRGFGERYLLGPMPENMLFRVASVEKPITAAAIRTLINRGTINWTDLVFNRDPARPPRGILAHRPWRGVVDNRVWTITVQNILNHRGGWNFKSAPIGDPQGASVQIADEMDVRPPAGRDNTIRYMLSQPLEFPPGTNGCMDNMGNPIFCYSNFGYMVLGRIVEQVTGMTHVDFIRRNILTPDMWVPSTEIRFGRTLLAEVSGREPIYSSGNGGDKCENVYNPDGDDVLCPYGGWHHESFVGHGNLVTSAAPLLVFMDRYQVAAGGISGTPLGGAPPMANNHAGALEGASSIMLQRNDGINIVVFFNQWSRNDPDIDHYASEMARIISEEVIDAAMVSTWPTECVDGFWVDFNSSDPVVFGSYNAPFNTMRQALGFVTDGTKLRFKPGATNWTGALSKKMRLDCPRGLVRIGAE